MTLTIPETSDVTSDVTSDIFERTESTVRSYARSFPATFATAKGDFLVADDGSSYIDFLAGAGTLNYGHNPEGVKQALIEYLQQDGLTHGLDLATTAKGDFLQVFQEHILAPRGLDHRVQFTSPSGTNAVEAALKLARLATGRGTVVAFSGGFHGVSAGSLAATGSGYYKQGLYGSLTGVVHVPYPDSPLGRFDSLDLLRRMVDDPSSGIEKPAAVLLETVQGEGGVFVAPTAFLQDLEAFCRRHGILLIVDDIQAGCGRTGSFFSFERAGITPDLITVSKSISGYGMPMALLLIRPEWDVWLPGQHNGTFRGNQLAFVGAAGTIRRYWTDDKFAAQVRRKGELVGDYLSRHIDQSTGIKVRGTGLIWGIDLSGLTGVTADQVSRLCFENGLVIESCGRSGEVIKLLPPLTISQVNLVRGLDILSWALGKLTGQGVGDRPREAQLA
jgi:diaminobutyrate-2-oxoglutarate transaminase